jgi:hypothetical protein
MDVDPQLIRAFWDYKEVELCHEFMHGRHKPTRYLSIRAKIREYRDASRLPKEGTCLLTDWYSFISKSDAQRDVLARARVFGPSDSMLQSYYDNVLSRKNAHQDQHHEPPPLDS